MTHTDGLTHRTQQSPGGQIDIVERSSDSAAADAPSTLVVLHEALVSDATWQELIADLPADLRVVGLSLPSDSLEPVLANMGITSAQFVASPAAAGLVTAWGQTHPVLTLTVATPTTSTGALRRDVLETIGYIGHRADPAPPTEAIILSSSD